MTYDLIVVGGGPGGTTAAAMAAKRGMRVALVDRESFPRDKVCGDAVSGKCLSVMRRMGLSDDLISEFGHGVGGLTFTSPSGELLKITYPQTAGGASPGFVCRRKTFDKVLLDFAVDSGADFVERRRVVDVVKRDDRVVGIRLKSPMSPSGVTTLTAPITVGADGANSTIARSLGLPHRDRRHFAAGIRAYYENVHFDSSESFPELHFLKDTLPGYFWIFPLGGGRANIGLGVVAHVLKQRKQRLKAMLGSCLQLPRFRDRFADATPIGPTKGCSLPYGSKPQQMAGGGWMLVGDAARLIDPFSGEGIGNAMISGESAATIADEAHRSGDFSQGLLRRHEEEVLAKLRPELRLSHVFQILARSPEMLNFVLRKASRSPEISEMINGMFDDVELRKKLASPLFYLRLLAV